MTLSSVKSDFEVPLGVKITGVDNSTYSLTGEAYSHVVPPKSESTAARVLQKDDVALGESANSSNAQPANQPAPARQSPLTSTSCALFVCTAYEFSRKFVSSSPRYTQSTRLN
jgi:hypothetical protein